MASNSRVAYEARIANDAHQRLPCAQEDLRNLEKRRKRTEKGCLTLVPRREAQRHGSSVLRVRRKILQLFELGARTGGDVCSLLFTQENRYGNRSHHKPLLQDLTYSN